MEEHGQKLMTSIRVYVRKFGLANDRASTEALSQEILQETVIAALRGARGYDESRPPLPWLRGVAFNVVRRRLRDETYGRVVSPVADVPLVRAVSQNPETGPLSEEDMFALLLDLREHHDSSDGPSLDELLPLLSDDDRRVLELTYFDGLSGKEVAAEMGISEGAAHTRLSRARERLRKAYNERNEQGLG
jgi:RNA polymerase sigma factor (sigma-70 family)